MLNVGSITKKLLTEYFFQKMLSCKSYGGNKNKKFEHYEYNVRFSKFKYADPI